MIEIYSRTNCSYCSYAKNLLDLKKINYTEYKLNEDFTKEGLLELYPTARTFPVVVIDGFYIGGYTQLAETLASQETDQKLLNEGIE